MKVGRNDLCPCGSGKKFKKCCGVLVDSGPPDFSLPEELLTGTPLDDYQHLIPLLGLYFEEITSFHAEGKVLKKAALDFERDFLPGTDEGVPESVYLPWLYFDFAFGRSQKTLCGRLLESPYAKGLGEPGTACLHHMAQSYSGFYEVEKKTKNHLIFRELMTGDTWKVRRLGEPEEEETQPGEIWYVRFVGPRHEESYFFSLPLIFPPDAKESFEKVLKAQVDTAGKVLKGPYDLHDVLAAACKVFLPFWAGEFMVGHHDQDTPLYNTDGELMCVCRLHFTIKVREGLKEALSSLPYLDYDEAGKMWIWFKKGKKQAKSKGLTALGTISVKRKYLVTETNSRERAEKLRNILGKDLKGYITFAKSQIKELDSLPSLTPEELEDIDKERAELQNDPEVREMLHQHAEEYYLKEWVHSKLPALANKTPLQAVKTPEGLQMVEELLDELELRQKDRVDDPFSIDVNLLRKRLRIPAKENQ